MTKILYYTCLLAILFHFGCKKETQPKDPEQYVAGKNRFTTLIDGVEREYYVHVPAGYSPNTATPVVFMLHGTGGNGEEFYTGSGWKEVGETDNILTVFPSALRYCITEDGETKNITKWNSQPTEWAFCAGEKPADDIQFFRTIIAELSATFNVNSKKIYVVGFSNGGQMAAKCSISMSDVLAAIVESAASFAFDSTYQPLRKLPVTFQVGNEDYGPGNEGPAITLSLLDTLISTPDLALRGGKHYRIANAHIKSFGLDPNFTISGDTNSVSIATYKSLTGDPDKSFRYVFVKGLKHAYPNGTSHPLEAAVLNWAWLKQYTL